jgi:hypothetical protein
MLIGKRGAGTTAIASAEADRVTVRGRDQLHRILLFAGDRAHADA